MAKKADDCGVRVYGNQHGHWVVITDKKLSRDVSDYCLDHNITPEELLRSAIDEFVDRLQAKVFLEMEHQERMSKKESK